MGLWQTGYMEFHEPTGLGDVVFVPKAVALCCRKCERQFDNEDALYEHSFSEHPYRSPLLLVDGIEITAPKHLIARRLSRRQIRLAHTAFCVINGRRKTPEQLIEELTLADRNFFSVRLEGEDRAVSTDYEIHVEIPNEIDLRGVEQRFFELAAGGELHVKAIQRFIGLATDHKTAANYLDALAHYLYGVLARDQRGGTSLTQSDGRQRFNMALQTLASFDTLLAKAVIEIVNFSQNAFNDGSLLNCLPRLQVAMRKFFRLRKSGTETKLVSWTETASSTRIPLDVTTDQLVEWAHWSADEVVAKQKELESVIRDDKWAPEDRFKVQVLLASAFADRGDVELASHYARRIRNDEFLGNWADGLLKKSKEV